jgi:hypothetical protein
MRETFFTGFPVRSDKKGAALVSAAISAAALAQARAHRGLRRAQELQGKDKSQEAH